MAGVVVLLALAGCGQVDIPETTVSPAERTACQALVKGLPASVSDQSQRDTNGNPLGGAWGDPAIVLRCGVGTPADYDPIVGCQRVNGMDWFIPSKGMDDQSADVVMTTYGRTPAVEVRLPAQYRPPVDAMVDLAADIEQHTRVVKRCS